MPPASLTTFPAELLIQVYKSLDNVKDVTALNLASHQFYDLWVSHTVSISDAVFSRTIKSFDDARELVKIQQKFVEQNHCDDDGHHDRYREALERNKLMISNVQNCLANNAYEKQDFSAPSDETLLSKINYCAWMLVLTTEDTFAQSSCLASLDLETLQPMFEIVGRLIDLLESGIFYVHFPPGIDFNKIGGRSQEDRLLNVRDTLEERISALKMAEEVGNGVEDI